MRACPICGAESCVYQLMPSLVESRDYSLTGVPATKEAYVAAERKAGFFNTLGHPREPATAAFQGGDGVRGQTFELTEDAS